ncbi:hypothetical protein B0H14DRAFT_2605160 [Mycena olivaceomarginata]|nr:hypothetical protein B0H14DRAFT_2605160 [Mycena olivaceomarginata]
MSELQCSQSTEFTYFIQLFIISDGELYVTGHNTTLLVVMCRVAGEPVHFCGEVFKDSGKRWVRLEVEVLDDAPGAPAPTRWASPPSSYVAPPVGRCDHLEALCIFEGPCGGPMFDARLMFTNKSATSLGNSFHSPSHYCRIATRSNNKSSFGCQMQKQMQPKLYGGREKMHSLTPVTSKSASASHGKVYVAPTSLKTREAAPTAWYTLFDVTGSIWQPNELKKFKRRQDEPRFVNREIQAPVP